MIRELGRLDFVKILIRSGEFKGLEMARAWFVRPREFVCFVWGRTKHYFSWLQKIVSQISPIQRISLAGRTTALMALLSAIVPDGRGVSQANASQNALQASAAPTEIFNLDFTVILAGLAIILLVMANLALWRGRKGSRSGADNPVTGKLALIADQSKRRCVDVELNSLAKEEQLARICHDLRTPLNAVIGFSDLMRKEMFGPLGHDKYVEYARHIGESGYNLLNTVDDIFDLTNSHGPAQIDQGPDLAVMTRNAQSTDKLDIKVPETAE